MKFFILCLALAIFWTVETLIALKILGINSAELAALNTVGGVFLGRGMARLAIFND